MTQIDNIKNRVSCRTYENRPIDQDLYNKIKSNISEPYKNPPFGTNAIFQIIHTPDFKGKHQIGTYGFINGAEYYIVGKIKQGKYDLEDFGYQMEKIILYATSLGLGTCWLGATFTRSAFGNIINLTDDEISPAISPIGYKAKKMGLLDRSLRKIAGSNNRKPFTELFFENSITTPIAQETSVYSIPLELVRLAPSASNKQPWRIIKEQDKNIFHFYLCRTGGYEKTTRLLNACDLQRVDMGIAMSHFESGAIELGLKGVWETTANPKTFEAMEYLVTWHG
jgi:nitroreductase